MSRLSMMYACQRNQALVLRAQGDLVASLRILQSLEDPIKQSGDKLEQAEYWQSIAHIQSDLHHYGQAMYFFAQAQHQFQQLGNQAAVAECLLEQAWLNIMHLSSSAISEQSNQSRLEKAETALQQAATELRNRPFHYWRVLYAQGKCAALQNRKIGALNLYKQASGIIALLRQEILNIHVSSAIFHQAQRLYTDAIQLAMQQYDSQTLFLLIEQQRSLNLYHHLQQNQQTGKGFSGRLPEDLQRQVQALLQDEGSSEAIESALQSFTEALLHASAIAPRIDRIIALQSDIDSVRSILGKWYPNGWLSVSYAFCDDQLLIMALDQHTIECVTVAFDANLKAMIDEVCLSEYRLYTYADLAYIDRPECGPWSRLSTLAIRLLPPYIQGKLHPNLRLLISPAGLLHKVPWAALRIGEAWLCERATIQIVPGIGYVQFIPKPPTQPGEGLLIGCRHFNGRADDLLHVGEELDHIAHAYTNLTIHRCEDSIATSECLTMLSETNPVVHYRFIHIATHAQLVAAKGLLAHIKFWDRELLFDEIAALKLDARLVVLSMCDGNLSEILPGEEVLSLSHGFLAAGVQAVISSLWPLEDELSPGIMHMLYAGLAQGLDAAAALTDMQRACITSRGRMSLPIAWAGLQIIGIDQLNH
ncbi:CHAT domain-containing protein [Herpetosiphon llansteffanensis]|uniref:CHAT domain-containing protein n=1 Tax=Herpetosiphon llansteffanensis TaxID=2094568 RepID=UPI000D7C5896|nr:CHAT domain-containing protein [Herpetosiphon llansteffanensis]